MPRNDRTRAIRFPCECDRFMHSLHTALEIPEPHVEDVKKMEQTLVEMARGRRDDLEHRHHAYIGKLTKVPVGQTENVRRVFEGEKARCRIFSPLKPLRALLSAPFRAIHGGADRMIGAGGAPWVVTAGYATFWFSVYVLVAALLMTITYVLLSDNKGIGVELLGVIVELILANWIISTYIDLRKTILALIPKRRGTRREWRAARKEWKRQKKKREEYLKRINGEEKAPRQGVLAGIANDMKMLFHDCPNFPEESGFFTFDSFVGQVAPSGVGVSAEMSEAYRKAPLSNFAYLPGALIRYRFWPGELEHAEREARPTDPVRVVARTFTALAMHRFFVRHGRWPGPGDLDKEDA